MTGYSGDTILSEVRYSAFGEIRYDSGTMTTDYLFTGQRQETLSPGVLLIAIALPYTETSLKSGIRWTLS